MNKTFIKSIFTVFVLTIASPVFLFAAVYPSSYDIVYHRISVTVDPGTSGAITNGSVTTYFKTRINNFTTMGFDFDQAMTLGAVKYHGTTVTATHSSNVLTITIPNIATKGTLDSVTVFYSGTPVAPVTSVPSGYNYSSAYKCIYTLGEAFRGNTWWPCRDSLVDKIDSVDVIVTTPSAYRAGSNGIVTETVVGPNRICTWKSRHPIATYMINFAAADYTNYQFNATSLTHTVPVLNYLYTSSDYNATYKTNLDVLKNVMPAYATLLNSDYPFYDEKYGTAECGSGWGALEVQSMTFIDRTSYGGTGYTLAHELAHQWFADKLTTNDWHQIWLNEGFAQFFQAVIYPEQLLSAGTAATQRSNLKSSVSTTSTTYVSNISNADNIFIGGSTQPYEKGAMTLSMLRAWLGNANFYTALHNYVTAPGLEYDFTSVDSLQKYMQAQTPNDLTQFFNDWVYQKGTVKYVVKYQYVANGVYIQLSSQTPTSAGAGYFDTPVPLEIKNSSGLDTTIVVIDRNGTLYNSATGGTYNANTIYYKLSATPTIAPVFDPNNNVLATASSIASSGTLSTLILLPVQDISLSLVPGNDRNAKINWKITADEPIESVEIEKSRDGISFESISKTAAVKILTNQYAGVYNDEQAGDGTIYYRLKVNKLSGASNYSAVKILNLGSVAQLNIAPNPVRDYCTISIPSSYLNQSQQISLLIYNSAGLLVQEKRLTPNASSVSVSCKSFTAGRYDAVLVNDKQQQLQTQFIKQ
ncbi:MAG: M1 family aminopeptidase [Bacteroidota bacterium]